MKRSFVSKNETKRLKGASFGFMSTKSENEQFFVQMFQKMKQKFKNHMVIMYKMHINIMCRIENRVD